MGEKIKRRLKQTKEEEQAPAPAPVRERLVPARLGALASARSEALDRLIIGQTQAKEEIVHFLQQYDTGLSTPGRPIGSFLFLGPTGTGKTRTVEALAEVMLKNPKAVIKIDCAEYQHSHEIAKLIGSPPGYLGHRETHPLLSQQMLDQNHTETVKVSFVLFDEIEKANDALWNLLLGILDKATLTLGDNRKVDFSRSMVFMTSNLGSNALNALARQKLGFPVCETDTTGGDAQARRQRSAVDMARKTFSTEFFNRIDKTITFHPLEQEHLRQVLDIELAGVRERIAYASVIDPLDKNGENYGFSFVLDEGARAYLLQEGFDARYNARHLKRAVETHILRALSCLIASGQVKFGDHIEISFDSEAKELVFDKTSGTASQSSAVVLPLIDQDQAA
jgi:ATP-dependent Clp protease ATP-binding subunit ClpB